MENLMKSISMRTNGYPLWNQIIAMSYDIRKLKGYLIIIDMWYRWVWKIILDMSLHWFG